MGQIMYFWRKSAVFLLSSFDACLPKKIRYFSSIFSPERILGFAREDKRESNLMKAKI